jgi:hypothetical protein
MAINVEKLEFGKWKSIAYRRIVKYMLRFRNVGESSTWIT